MAAASHYLYKGERQNDDDWLLHVREVLENPAMVSFETSYRKQHKYARILIRRKQKPIDYASIEPTVSMAAENQVP